MNHNCRWTTAGSLLCVLLAFPALAFQEPHHHDTLPNLDRRQTAPGALAPAAADPARAAALTRVRSLIPGVRVDFDEALGAPKFISSPHGFLTGPEGKGGGGTAATAAGVAANDPHRAVKSFLTEHSALFGHGAEVLPGARTQREFSTAHNGMRTTVWQQELEGIRVFEAVLISHVTKRGELVNIASQFIPNPAAAANAAQPNRAALLQRPAITPQQALALAARNVGDTAEAEDVSAVEAPAAGAERRQKFRAGRGVRGEADLQLVWLPMNRAALRLCWEVIFTSAHRGEMFRVLVDAETGEVSVRQGLTHYISPASYRVFPSDSPTPFSPGHLTPLAGQPPLVSRVLVTTNAFNTNASPNGWIDDGVNETRGNNVDAHTDRDANNTPDTPRPQGSPFRVFDFPIDFGQAPATYSNASVVQLFYYCNWIHDRFYELGFTEAAGNFQLNNFGRGGAGNDPVQADAQDGDGFNNANFSTPPDGSSGRMQMFLFDGPTPDIDGDFDGEIVIHEYTHGLSNRRVGNGVGISQLQSAGMGEGWSDFYGLCLLSEPADNVDANYAVGGYATRDFFGLQQNYYFGIRRYPYSTDLTKNPLTFKDIDPTQFSSHPGIPINPVVGGGGASQVHNQGTVWCVTLWEVRANLVRKHGHAIGNQLMLQLVTDGMNLSPANPNFVQARDAILQAELVLTGGANRLELWKGFAKRGLGAFATSPASSTTTGVQENFDLPDDLSVTPAGQFNSTGPVTGPFSLEQIVFNLSNTGSSNLTWVATSRGLLEPSLGGSTLGAGGSITLTARLSSASRSLPAGAYADEVVFTNQTSGIVQRRPFTLIIGERNYFTENFDTGDNDLDNGTLTFVPDGSESFYGVCRSAASVFPTDPAGGTPLSLTDDSFQQITLTGGARVSHYGRQTNVFFIGSNGYLTYNFGDTTFSASLPGHFLLPRVAALFRDLDPSAGGTVSWKQLPDRVAVTWLNVPNFGSSVDVNSFQIELFFDGTIRITHLAIASTTGLCGISQGQGVPASFVETDLSAVGGCGAALRLEALAGANEDAGLLPSAGRVILAQPTPVNLTVNLTSSLPAEVGVPPSVTILAGATSAVFSVTFVDDALLNGTRLVRLTASAGGYRPASAIASVFDTESAALSVSLPVSARENDGLLAGAGRVTMSAAADRALVVSLSSPTTNELSLPATAVIVSAGNTSAAFHLLVVDDNRIDGDQTGSVTAFVQNWIPGGASMTVFDNEETNLFVTLPAVVSEGNGTLPGAGTISLQGSVISNVTVQLASSDLGELIVPATVVVLAGQSSASFDLTVLDDAAIDGPKVVTVTASATGFTSGQEDTLVEDNESPVAPFLPRPPDFASNVELGSDLAWSSGVGEQILNGGFETGELTAWTREDTGVGAWVINNGTFDPESADGPLPPRSGSFSALARQQSSGRHALYQDVFIPSGATFATLRWADRIRNHAPEYAANQQFRVEIRNQFNAVQQVVLATAPGQSLLNDWTNRMADLGAYRGQFIRVAFVVEDSLGHLNVHLDDVSVDLGSPAPTTFDVYFGTNATPGAAEFLGNTTNTTWSLPPLAQFTTYYWQVVARRGSATVAGPVWRFTTRGSTSLNTLVRLGSLWRYLDNGTDQGTAWRGTNFNDSGWSGPSAARLGYGGDGEVTTIGFGPNSSAKYITSYFRRSFVISNAASFFELTARLTRDDGAVIYLNDTEIFRSNMPGGTINFLTLASSTVNAPNETALFSSTVNPGLLREGTNVLAAEVHQVLASSSDLGFDIELFGTAFGGANNLPSVAVTTPLNYALITTPGTSVVGATAADADGTVAKIAFFVDGVLLGEDATAPYSLNWGNPSVGLHQITAVATDNLGATNVSAPIHVVVNRAGGLPIALVPAGSVWRYLDDGSNQDTAWRTTNFVDSAWFSGPAQLGYGDGDESTLVGYGPDPNNRFVTTYFRNSFTNTAAFSTLSVNLLRDDGAVVYLNGTEVFRSNMPGTAIDYLTLASSAISGSAENIFNLATISTGLLQRGRNVIAVELHQNSVTSSDISFDLELSGVGNFPPSVSLTAPAHPTTLPYPQPVALTASASDAYGTISRVEFFDGALKLGESTTPPYGLMWNNPPVGVHTLTALATDNNNGTNRSSAVTLTINPAPTLTLLRTGGTAQLIWPVNPAGFILESSTNLVAPINWTAVTNDVTSGGGMLSVTVEVNGSQSYFRLRHP